MRMYRFLFLLAVLILIGFWMWVAVAPQPKPPFSEGDGSARSPADTGLTTVVMSRGTGRIVTAGEDLARFADYLESRLPVRIRIRIISDGREYQRRIVQGEFDLLHLGPLEYVEAHRRSGVEPVISPIYQGSKTYKGMIVTNDPSIRRIADLKGRRLTYVDEESASGLLYPLALMLQEGLDPLRDCSVFEASGSHENVILNLVRKRYDAGFCIFDNRARVLGPDQADRLPIVATTPSIPSGGLGVSKEFLARAPAVAAQIRQVLLDMHKDSEGLTTMSAIFRGADRCVPVTDSDFTVVKAYLPLIERYRRMIP